jgi:hypothetical protein
MIIIIIIIIIIVIALSTLSSLSFSLNMCTVAAPIVRACGWRANCHNALCQNVNGTDVCQCPIGTKMPDCQPG